MVLRLTLAGLAALALVLVLAGCAQQDEVIGYGPASLIFTNEGSDSVDVRVAWIGSGGDWLSRSFTVYVDGRVELRLSDRLEYYIELDGSCSSLHTAMTNNPAPPGPKDQVITLDHGEPCDPPKGARTDR